MRTGTHTDASVHEPAGAIPRVQPYRSDKAFLSAVQPEYALINYTDARRLLKRGEDAGSWFPDETSVITTTTIRDEELNLVTWGRELERVIEFDPDWHIPTDYSTYGDDDESDRITATLDCMEGTLWMQRKLREHDADIQIIPLVKGTTELERQACYNVFEEAGFNDLCAYYATQYFTSGNGIQINELVEDVRAIAREQDRPIMLIGLLSANYLDRMPGQVTTAAGQNAWRKPIAPTTTPDKEIRQQWDEIAADVERAIASTPEAGEPPATTEA